MLKKIFERFLRTVANRLYSYVDTNLLEFHITKLVIQPDDTLVLKVDEYIPPDITQRLKEAIKANILVIDKRTELYVTSTPPEPPV